MTPQILWEGYDPESEPLNATLLTLTELSDMLVYTLYFDGEKSAVGGVIRIFANLYVPKKSKATKKSAFSKNQLAEELNIKNLTDSLVVVFDDIVKSVNTFDPSLYLNNGFCVLAVDYAGVSDKKSRFTIYPREFKKANYFLHPESIQETDTPKDSSWYIWQTVALRSCFFAKSLGVVNLFMLGVGHGLEMVFKTAYFNSALTGAVTQYSGGILNAKNLQYIASLDATAYAQHSKCPILMQLPSNEANSSLEEINAVFETAINSSEDTRFLIQERSITCVDLQMPIIWFKSILDGAKLPKTPKLEPKVSQNKLYYNITACASGEIKSVSLFVAHIESKSAFRNWRSEALQSVGEGEYLASIEVVNCEAPLYAFTTVVYNSGLIFSSPVSTVNPKSLGLNTQILVQKRLVYDTEMGTADWHMPCLSNCFKLEKALSTQSGALGLEGLTSAKNTLKTFKLADPQYKGSSGNSLQLMIEAKTAQNISFNVFSIVNSTLFSCTKEFVGSNSWIKTSLSPYDFKSKGGESLSSWQDILTFEITSNGEFLLNSILWV